MKHISTLLLLFCSVTAFNQEFESDLFHTLTNSSLHIFMKSELSRMEVVTYRNSEQHGIVEETTSTYKKGKIMPARINFTITYSEFYILEDRKKSLGRYEFENDRFCRYERTDFDNRNLRMYTMYHYFHYDNNIVLREDIRTKEYVGTGSIDMDTVVYKDSVIYTVQPDGINFRQDNLTDPGSYSIYTVTDGKLVSKTNYFEGFNEKITYVYDSKQNLIKIENVLTGEDGNTIKSWTDVFYDMNGLMSETKFYDQNGELLERKAFSYK